jgi:hypothetical protein
MKYIIIIILIFSNYLISLEINDHLNAKAVVDIFYSYDFNEPQNHVRQPFFYQFNRHNEINLNMALLALNYENEMIRGNLTLQAGTYAQDNYAAEEGMLKNIFESYLGVRLNESGSAWIDAGIFGSHLGFESAINHENPVLTRSFSSESSPYFLSGIRANWQANESLLLGAVISNGWQRISRVDGNQSPATGIQVQYTPNNFTFNYSNFIFNDDENTTELFTRHFHNIYAKYDNNLIYFLAGYDIGFATNMNNENWSIASILLGYKITDNWQISSRFELINDPNNFVIPISSIEISESNILEQNNFEAIAVSFGIDRIIGEGLFLRSEARYLNNSNEFFVKNDEFTQDNLTLTFSISKTID